MFLFGMLVTLILVFIYNGIKPKSPIETQLDELVHKRMGIEEDYRRLEQERSKMRENIIKELTRETTALENQRLKTEREIENLHNKRAKDFDKLEIEKKAHREQIAEMAKQFKELEKLSFEKLTYHKALEEITNYWINESFQDILDRMSSTNYATLHTRMTKIFEKCEKLGLSIEKKDITRFEKALKDEHALAVTNQKAKEEQNRIKELMKEEQRAEKVRAEEIKRIEKEQKEIAKKKQENEERLKLLKELEDLKQLTLEQQEELNNLNEENVNLAVELESKERAKSMAEMTKAGHVYVISNIGSFGEEVYKIGMTRRLIPEDRIKELGDASVPFPFDVHMMISSENAPLLESLLHEELWHHRLNWVNNHKEFFKVPISKIKEIVEKNCKEGTFQLSEYASANQWRESMKLKELGTDVDYDPSSEESEEEEAA